MRVDADRYRGRGRRRPPGGCVNQGRSSRGRTRGFDASGRERRQIVRTSADAARRDGAVAGHALRLLFAAAHEASRADRVVARRALAHERRWRGDGRHCREVALLGDRHRPAPGAERALCGDEAERARGCVEARSALVGHPQPVFEPPIGRGARAAALLAARAAARSRFLPSRAGRELHIETAKSAAQRTRACGARDAEVGLLEGGAPFDTRGASRDARA